MKKIIIFFMTMAMVMGASVLAESEIKVVMEDEAIAFDTTPVIVNDRVMVPMRAIFEELGATVKWDGERSTAEALFGDGTHVMLTIGKESIYKNNEAKTIDSAPFIQNDRTMVPVRFVSEASGASVSWDGETRTVKIVPVWRVMDFVPFTDNMDVPAPSAADKKMKITNGRKDGEASVYTYDISAAGFESVVKYEQILGRFGYNLTKGDITDKEKVYYNGKKVVKTSIDGDTYVIRIHADSTGDSVK